MIVTGLYAALLGLIYIGLSIYVIRYRFQARIVIGDNDDQQMQRRIRIHANFIEYTPLFLILLALADYAATSFLLLHIMGGIFVMGRLFHIGAMSKALPWQFRPVAMLSTFGTILVLSVLLIINFSQSL